MTDLDPEIWENKTLGSANGLPNLEDISEQKSENLAAMREQREPVVLPPVTRFSNESTNMTLIEKTNGDIVDPSVKTPGLAYFHPSQLDDDERVAASVPKQEKNNTHKTPAPTAKTAANNK